MVGNYSDYPHEAVSDGRTTVGHVLGKTAGVYRILCKLVHEMRSVHVLLFWSRILWFEDWTCHTTAPTKGTVTLRISHHNEILHRIYRSE